MQQRSLAEDWYPSRVGAAEDSLRERIDPVVYGSAASGPLDPGQVAQYQERGYLVVEGWLEDRVEQLSRAFGELAARPDLRDQPEVFTEPDSDAVRSIFAPHELSDTFADVARDPRMLDSARQLLGGDVYIHQSRFNVKPALHGRSFPWHSDFETWHVEDGVPYPRIVTGWIFISENTAFNGSLVVVPRSHRHYVSCAGTTPPDNYRRSLRRQETGSPQLETLQKLTRISGGQLDRIVGRPGTVVFHEGNLMHCSPDNPTPWPRTNLFFVYNSVDNRPVAPYCGLAERPAFLSSRDTRPLYP